MRPNAICSWIHSEEQATVLYHLEHVERLGTVHMTVLLVTLDSAVSVCLC